jgi:hypothetical protein
MLAAVYVELPLPEPRAAREARAQIKLGEINAPVEEPGFGVVEIPLHIGWRDIDNASINVLVPDFVEIHAADGEGNLLQFRHGSMLHTPDPRESHPGTGSNYWQQTRMHLSAFTNQSLTFRLSFRPPVEKFSIDFLLYASALQGGIEVHGEFAPERDENTRGT